jgi:hypothetical protein
LLVIIITPGFTPAATTNLVPVADACLFEHNPNNNLGGNGFLPAGVTSTGERARALLRFDLTTAVPAGSAIHSATLGVAVSVANGAGKNFNLHRLRSAWNEGTGAGFGGGNVGAPANAGEVTWNNRAHPATPWTQPGAQAGADYVSLPSASTAMTSTALSFSSAGLAADVQLWLNQPATNHGWIIILDGEPGGRSASRLDSRESATPPVLTLNYTPPGPVALTISGVTAAGGQFRFAFNGQSGQAYTVEGRTNLNSGWFTVTNIPTLSATGPVQVTNSISGSQHYFRVRTP